MDTFNFSKLSKLFSSQVIVESFFFLVVFSPESQNTPENTGNYFESSARKSFQAECEFNHHNKKISSKKIQESQKEWKKY